jgi:NAD-reducing hydrogenase small subunit
MSETKTKVRLATVWLDGCSGCHMSFLDMDDRLLGLAGLIDLVYSPLVDNKVFPESVDVTLVEGSVSTDEEIIKITKIRKHTKLLVVLGDCAVTGNVPAMRNNIPVKKLLESIYIQGVTTAPGVPKDGVPALLRHASPLHESVRVDLHVPGCPPKSDAIAFVLKELLDGHKIDLTGQVKFG